MLFFNIQKENVGGPEKINLKKLVRRNPILLKVEEILALGYVPTQSSLY